MDSYHNITCLECKIKALTSKREDESRMNASYAVLSLLGSMLAAGYVFAFNVEENVVPSNSFRRIQNDLALEETEL